MGSAGCLTLPNYCYLYTLLLLVMTWKIWRNIGIAVVLVLIVTIWVVNYIVVREAKSQLYYNTDLIPKNKVGLLLGTAKYMDKARNIVNPYYQYRIDAAVALYMAGKVDYIIVSGDNSTRYYNEPLLMRNDLVARGVPLKNIVMDNAGFRTLDSILRCRDIFGQKRFTIISQTFHNERAVYIANRKGVETVGFCCADGHEYVEETIREKLARVKMMLDLLFNKQAKFYGDKVNIE